MIESYEDFVLLQYCLNNWETLYTSEEYAEWEDYQLSKFESNQNLY